MNKLRLVLICLMSSGIMHSSLVFACGNRGPCAFCLEEIKKKDAKIRLLREKLGIDDKVELTLKELETRLDTEERKKDDDELKKRLQEIKEKKEKLETRLDTQERKKDDDEFKKRLLEIRETRNVECCETLEEVLERISQAPH
jgi:hypothetical protein